MDRAIGVNVYVCRQAARRLGLEDSIQGSGAVLSDIDAWPHAAVVRQDGVKTIFVKHTDRATIEEIAVLAEDERLRPLPHHGLSRQHEDVFQPFYGYAQPEPSARPEPPQKPRCAVGRGESLRL